MAKYGGFKYGAKKYGPDTLVAAGITHHVVLDNYGLMLASIITKSDITQSTPRVSIGTNERRHTDFSERDTWGQQSYHHGYGADVVTDPYTFKDSSGVVTWIPNQLTLMPDNINCAKTTGGSTDLDGHAVSILAFEGNLYILVYGTAAAANALYLYDNTTDTLTLVTSGISTTTGSPAQLFPYDGSMFVAQGEADNGRRFTGSVWSDNGVPAKFYEAYDGALWRADNIFELYYSVDPTNDSTATWQGPLEVGDSSYPIRGMVGGFDGALWVGKDDGIYSVRKVNDVNYQVTKVIDLINVVSDKNGEAMIVYGANLYFSAGYTIGRYDGSTIQFMGPDRGNHEWQMADFNVANLPATFQSGVAGNVTSFAHDNTFLYCTVDNEGVASSRVMLWTGTGWHTVYRTTSTSRVKKVFFTKQFAASGTLSYPHLWWTDSSGEVLKRQKKSRFSHNPLDETLNYVSSGWIITPWFDANLIDIDKTFFDFIMNVTQLSVGGNSLTVEFQVNDYDVWYTLGTVYKSPESVLFFPDNGQLDPAIFARKIRYRITLTRSSGTTTTTPILKSYGHRFVVRPESRYGWNLIVKCYDEFDDLRRYRHDGESQEIRRFLYGLRDKRTPIQLFDGTELPSLTNLVTNPSVEIDTNSDGAADGITAVGTATFAMTAQHKTSGTLSQKVTVGAGTGTWGAKVGTTYRALAGHGVYAAADVFVESGNYVDIEVLNSAGTVVASHTIRVSGIESTESIRFTRHSVYFVADATDDYTFRFVRRESSGVLATVFYLDALEFITASVTDMGGQPNGDYIDGDQLRCRWNGTPHASTSVRQKGYFVYITTFTESFRFRESKSETTAIESQFALSLREAQ